MPAPIIDGDAIDLRVNEDTYHSGGVLAGLNGSLLTWAVNVAVKGRIYVFGSGQSRPIDAVSHDLGPAETLNLNIGAKPTYVIDMDQLGSGNVVVSWSERVMTSTQGPEFHSYFRMYNAAGHAVSPKLEILTAGNDPVGGATVTALGNGGFCASWSQYRNGSTESFAQIFAADGTAAAPSFRLNRALAGDQNMVGTTAIGADGLFAMWQDRQDDGTETLVGRVFGTAGAAEGAAFVIADVATDAYFRDIQAIALANGDVAVIWQAASVFGAVPDTVNCRILNADGTVAVDRFTIATASGLEGDQAGLESPSIVALDDGRWMVAWADVRFDAVNIEHISQIHARIYNADGSVAEESFDLAPGLTMVDQPHLVVLADGRVAVHYSSGWLSSTDFARVQIIDPRLAAVDLTGTAMGDQLQGTVFDDRVEGVAGGDKLAGMAGNDLLNGGTQGDTLLGGDGNDVLSGGGGGDLLSGGAGNDHLTSGKGDDVLTGGQGSDSFVFGPRSGQDRITDFKVGADSMNLHAYHFATEAEALSHFTQTAGGAQFAFGAEVVLLVGIDAASLGAGSLVL